jgi:FtsP/CotA-like multicopper oxidase with cupredoxin domain
MRRDNSVIFRAGHDSIGFMFDTYHDRRSGYIFNVNASGGRADGQFPNERQYNGDWNPVWDLSVGQFDGGWTVEAAIPFKSLRYAPGETQVWTIVNKTKWSHPFHLHGFFFQVLDEKGQHVTPLEWKDTVNVPLEQTLKLVVRYDDDRPGSWMYHCHILDHADGGLMGMVDVGVPHVDHSGHSH